MKISQYLREVQNYSGRSLRNVEVFLNGKQVRLTKKLPSHGNLKVVEKKKGTDIKPIKLPIDIVFEDEDILVVNKEPFLLTHPTQKKVDFTLANGIVNHFLEKYGEVRVPRFYNRLDMNTSGLVVIAKNSYAHHRLSLDMGQDRVHKEYLAIVEGIVEKDSGTLDFPIYREAEDSISRIVDPRGQRSITHFRVLQRLDGASLVSLRLETGRTHQIRVHLSHIGHPIIGDDLYGRPDTSLIDRQALHAYKLTFDQPRLGDKIDLRAGLPLDMLALLEKLGGVTDDYK